MHYNDKTNEARLEESFLPPNLRKSIYVVDNGAFEADQGPGPLRQAILNYDANLQDFILHKMQFFAKAVPLNRNDPDSDFGFRIENTEISFGMVPVKNEDPEKPDKWKIWARPRIRSRDDKRDDLMRLPLNMPRNKAFRFFTEGVKEFDTLDEAFKEIRYLAGCAAINLWQANPMLKDIESNDPLDKHMAKLRDKIRASCIKAKDFFSKPFLLPLSVGLGVSTLSFLVTKDPGTSLAKGVGTTIGTGLLTKAYEMAAEGALSRVWKKTKQVFKGPAERIEAWERQNNISVNKRSYDHLIIDQTPQNLARFAKKMQVDVLDEARPLTFYQTKLARSLNPNPSQRVYSDDPVLEKTGLLTMTKRIRAAVMARYADTDMMSAFYPNGVTGFRRAHEDLISGRVKVDGIYAYDPKKSPISNAVHLDHFEKKDGEPDKGWSTEVKSIQFSVGEPENHTRIREVATQKPVNDTVLEEQTISKDDGKTKIMQLMTVEFEAAKQPVSLLQHFEDASNIADPVPHLETLIAQARHIHHESFQKEVA